MSVPPKIIKPYVVSFCRSIVSTPEPRYVPLEPLDGVEPDSCFETVVDQIKKYGGTQQIGWAIWEWPKVLIEAEFHCIWIAPDGREFDITPKKLPMPRILFLPDPKRRYEGFQRDNFRKPLCKDKDVLRLIAIQKAMHAELNRGELKYVHGEVAMGPRYIKLMRENTMIQERLAGRYGDFLSDAMSDQLQTHRPRPNEPSKEGPTSQSRRLRDSLESLAVNIYARRQNPDFDAGTTRGDAR